MNSSSAATTLIWVLLLSAPILGAMGLPADIDHQTTQHAATTGNQEDLEGKEENIYTAYFDKAANILASQILLSLGSPPATEEDKKRVKDTLLSILQDSHLLRLYAPTPPTSQLPKKEQRQLEDYDDKAEEEDDMEELETNEVN